MGNPGAMTGAVMGEAKLHGLLVDRTEDVTKAGDMTPAALADELARVRAELEAIERGDQAEAPDQPTEH